MEVLEHIQQLIYMWTMDIGIQIFFQFEVELAHLWELKPVLERIYFSIIMILVYELDSSNRSDWQNDNKM